MRLPTAILLALVLSLNSGCSGMLPVAKTTDESRWDSFDQVKGCLDLVKAVPAGFVRGFGHRQHGPATRSQAENKGEQDGGMQAHGGPLCVGGVKPGSGVEIEDHPSLLLSL